MQQPPRLPARFAAAIVGAACACGGAAATGRAPDAPLPAYRGHAVELFDDTIEPRAVGFELERTAAPRADALLRERTQVGDAVLRGRVTTVTSKDEDKGRTWQVGLHVIHRLAGKTPVGDDVTVELGPGSPSAGILRSWEGRLIGKSFILFVREFAREGSAGDSDLHFHLVRDGEEEAAAVRAAYADSSQAR
ncbi:MAG: cobalamin ABC transporter substrate-binding protein [Myxococcales bacterium]|nr:cobalamin ABC transporter substrate-binding protein [Myxococcales bacterium]